MRKNNRLISRYESLKVIMYCILLAIITVIIGLISGEISVVVK